ncbi:AbrB/MazE/SpoVT family DNA-binding domain-containing protein [Candidatus Pacearchaeota archaeon]|nr:AbrB/MazE/SpoVT family DNA-binding domain-containing protein [Candidatus Pacearchaeota archaeon]
MEQARITSKGQITIPKGVRQALGLKEGKEVIFIIEGGGAIMRPKTKNPLEELAKLRKEIHFTPKEIKEMIKESKKEWSKIE